MTIHINKSYTGNAQVLGCDLETTGLDVFAGRSLSCAFSDGTDVWIYLDFYGWNEARRLLEDKNILKIFHNSVFDMMWIKRHMQADVCNMFDTMLAERVLTLGKRVPAALDEVLARYFGIFMEKDTRKEFIDHPGFAFRPVTNDQISYMAEDVLYLPRLREAQLSTAGDLLRTMELENEVAFAVVALQLGGITLDVDLWYQHKAHMQTIIEQSEQRMRAMIGDDFMLQVERVKQGVPYIEEIPGAEVNINAWQQGVPLLKQRFGTNAPNYQEATLQNYVDRGGEVGEFCELLLRHKHMSKLTGYGYDKYINPVTGKIHAEYHQLGARTGRFSSSNPNMQNVPRPAKGEPNLRHIFRSDTDDYVIIRADYSQQEPRVMAQLSGDPDMIKACNGTDVYIEFGKVAYGETIDKHDPRRHIMKTFVLATGYGAGADKLAAASGLSKQEAIKIRNLIRDKFPVMAQFGDKMYRQAVQYKFVSTMLGRRRWMDGNISFTEAVNSPVQGTAADMFKLAMVKIHKRLTNEIASGKLDTNTRLWNLVHDEIEVHCHKDQADYVNQLVIDLMEEAGSELCPDVKHIAESAIDMRWDK